MSFLIISTRSSCHWIYFHFPTGLWPCSLSAADSFVCSGSGLMLSPSEAGCRCLTGRRTASWSMGVIPCMLHPHFLCFGALNLTFSVALTSSWRSCRPVTRWVSFTLLRPLCTSGTEGEPDSVDGLLGKEMGPPRWDTGTNSSSGDFIRNSCF